MEGLRDFIAMLTSSKVQGHVWVDGSFTSQKIDPDDVDVVLVCDGTLYDNGADEYRLAVDLVISNLKKTIKCDSYVCMQYPVGHPLYEEGVWNHAWYLKQWGFSRDEEMKGILVVSLGEMTP